METREFNIGDYVIANDRTICQIGKVENKQMSTGSRKEMIYKVGVNYFFADEMEYDYHAMVRAMIDGVGGVKPFKPYEKKFTFTHKKVKHTLAVLCASSSFAYIVTEKGDLFCLTYMKNADVKRLYDFLVEAMKAKIPFYSGWE